MIILIAAIDEKNGIGKDNKMPWHLPFDLKRFKKLTYNHIVIMGRNTFESMGGPLKGRTNIVITSHPMDSYELDSTTSLITRKGFNDIDAKILSRSKEKIFVIGGGQIFNYFLDFADMLYLTRIEHDYECDTFFPDFQNDERPIKWNLFMKTYYPKIDGFEYPITLETYMRNDLNINELYSPVNETIELSSENRIKMAINEVYRLRKQEELSESAEKTLIRILAEKDQTEI